MVVRLASLVVVLAALGCGDSSTYHAWMKCEAGYDAGCPPGAACPALPAGSGGCASTSPCDIGQDACDYLEATHPGVEFPQGCSLGVPGPKAGAAHGQVICTCGSSWIGAQPTDWVCLL